ncbi:hypothetical protein L208DRAFT_1332181 [Tricholoma matsutake]|nr:hypothetical protein L208DRAFT_1332181 [Tricholoma matsutake 945]
MYPINDFFPRVNGTRRRINRHPSNAQWAGGNVIEGVVMYANQSLENGVRYLDKFVRLLQIFLHDIVVSQTCSLLYTACSTMGGVLILELYLLNSGMSCLLKQPPPNLIVALERFNYDPRLAFNYNTYPTTRLANEFGSPQEPN